MISRRACFAAAVAAGAPWLAAPRASALGRTPVGGELRIMLPWPLSQIDPHDLGDPGGALFGHAIFDQLFAIDSHGDPHPTLAALPPAEENGRTLLRLRQGLLSARGEPIDARDVAFSLARARASSALAWISNVPVPTVHASDPLALVFARCDAVALARALSSPLLAIVPRSFQPGRPDGTGAMMAELSPGQLTLSRNVNAARGSSFLDSVRIEQAPDLAASLRSFEGNLSDIGWLGSGLHAPRPNAVPFDCGRAGYITLHTGKEAGPWSAPGTAQRLIDGLAPERLQQFALGPRVAPPSNVGWGARACDLLVQEGSAFLEALAGTLASLISRPGHEVTPRPVSARELSTRRANGAYSLLLGIVRPFDSSALGTLIALTSAENPAAAVIAMQKPPHLLDLDPRLITRTLRVGVLGDLRVMGAHVPSLHLVPLAPGNGWDFAASFVVPS